jgi:hypothetical protein
VTHVFEAVCEKSTLFQLEGHAVLEEDSADAVQIVEEGR